MGCKVGEVTLSRAYWVGTIIRGWQELDEYTRGVDVEKMPRVWTDRCQSRYGVETCKDAVVSLPSPVTQFATTPEPPLSRNGVDHEYVMAMPNRIVVSHGVSIESPWGRGGVEYGAQALRERLSRLPGMDWIMRAHGSVENTAVTEMD